jgi:hypothetical protein
MKFASGIFVILLLFPIACAGARMQAESSGVPQEYFPLKTGLYWKYRYAGMPRNPVDVEIRIGEEKEINGKRYFRFSNWFTLSRNISSGDSWVSWHEGSIYLYDGKMENRVIGANIEQTELKRNDPASPVATAAGNFSDAILFQECVGCADAGSQYYFARGKGIVLVTMTAIWGGAQYELIETNAP